MTEASLGLLMLSAILMHRTDRLWKGGWGVGYLLHRTADPKNRSSEKLYVNRPDSDSIRTFVPSALTRESIQVAITVGILVMLVTDDTAPAPLVEIFESSDVFLYHSVVGMLAISVVTTLAAILCYDYSLRFRWKSETIAVQFVLKAGKLQQGGFYALMLSLAAIAGMTAWQVGTLASVLVYFVMWVYYFFEEGFVGELQLPGTQMYGRRGEELAPPDPVLEGVIAAPEEAPSEGEPDDK